MEENISVDINANALNKMKEAVDFDLVEQALTKDEIEFLYKDKQYKVRKLTSSEKQNIYQVRMEKYMELLQIKDENGNFKYKSEEELRKLYTARGIDISDIEDKMLNLEVKRREYQKKIGEGLSTEEGKAEAPVPELLNYKEEIENIATSIQELSLKKSRLLEFTLENQTLIYVIGYAISIITEIKEEEAWKRVWNSYEEFVNGEEGLVNKASYIGTLLTSNLTPLK